MYNLSTGQKKALNAGADIDNICQPLFQHTDITDFAYTRVNKNAGQLTVSTHTGWLEDYFMTNDHLYKIYLETPEFLKDGRILWACVPGNTTVKNAREKFKIDNGITLMRHNENYSEAFSFGSTIENTSVNNWYVNNLDILEQFILYFKDRSYSLVQSIEPTKATAHELIKSVSELNMNLKIPTKEILFSKLEPKHVIYNINHKEIILTRSEYNCIQYLLQGYTAKSIGQKLSLSSRTIESYILNVKKKVDCHYKSDLVQLFKN